MGAYLILHKYNNKFSDRFRPKFVGLAKFLPTPLPPARRSDPFGPACRQAGWTIPSFSLAANSF